MKVGVLISGRGSNLQALIEACHCHDFPAEIRLVISNNADARGLDLAREAGIATAVIDHRQKPRPDFDAEIDAALRAAGIELVCLAGFMRLLGADFVQAWIDRLINIHPSLLPAYRGTDVHARVLADGAKVTGCTVHFVRPATDAGPIVMQAKVPVAAHDTPETLAARVLAAEHQIYPAALRLIAEGRVKVVGERVEIDGRAGPIVKSQYG